jgi:import inner membrane translocase subunit TIM23
MALSPFRTTLTRSFLSTQVRLSSTKAAAQNAIPTWNDYFKLRKKRRVYEVASYLPSTVTPAAGTLAYFFQMQVDPLTKVLGMDPVMAAVASTFAAVSLRIQKKKERTKC